MKDGLSWLKWTNRSEKSFHFYNFLFGCPDVGYRFGTHKPEFIVPLMDIHPFMKRKFNPDISVLPQHTDTHGIHDGGLRICASWQESE